MFVGWHSQVIQPSHEAFKTLYSNSMYDNRIALGAFTLGICRFHLEDITKWVRMLKQTPNV